MTATEKGVTAANTDISVDSFNGIIVKIVIVSENVVTQGIKLPQHEVSRFGKRTFGQYFRILLYLG